MKVKLKNTVGLTLHPAIEYAMGVVNRVWFAETSTHPVLTGLQEEGHSKGSLHYGILDDIRCRAFDVRIHQLTARQEWGINLSLEKRLAAGLEFDIVWESTHLHIEFDPKD